MGQARAKPYRAETNKVGGGGFPKGSGCVWASGNMEPREAVVSTNHRPHADAKRGAVGNPKMQKQLRYALGRWRYRPQYPKPEDGRYNVINRGPNQVSYKETTRGVKYRHFKVNMVRAVFP